jgi:hypothetical protein
MNPSNPSNTGKFIFPLSGSIEPTTNPKDITKLLITSPGYESLEVIPYKGDGTAKDNLGVISLTPTTKGLEQDKLKASQLTKAQIEELSTSKKDFKYFSQEKLTNQIDTLKSVLIPTVLTLIAGFGITKATDLAMKNKDKILEGIKNKYTCPPQAQLLDIINKKNKLVKQLNNSLKIIDSTTKALGIAGGVIEGLDIAYNVLKNLPVPVSTGVPGVPGLPTNVILGIQDGKDKLDKLITNLKTINTSTLTILVLLRQVLLQAIQLLNLLDSLVQECFPDADQEQISTELTALTQQQSTQQSPVVTNVNGFEMGVVTEVTDKPLKRRRAIARNKSGVVMLQGEWSFSSINQILIDELVFYIQQNNLKAD